MEHFNMYIPTRAIFGAGELNNLHKQAMPGRRALVVISNGRSTRANGYLDRLEEQLKLTGISYAVFDKVEANPLVGTVMAGGMTARENGCDMIVALGGGSVIDAAKAIAVVATNDGTIGTTSPAGRVKAMRWNAARCPWSPSPLLPELVRKRTLPAW